MGPGARVAVLPLAAASAALLLLASASGGCASRAGSETAAPARAAERGVPIGRSVHPRSGHLSYRLGKVDRQAEAVRVDMQLTNATHRDYQSLGLRVVLYGDGGEIQTRQVAVGSFRDGRTKPISAHFDQVGFRIQDVGLELIYSSP